MMLLKLLLAAVVSGAVLIVSPTGRGVEDRLAALDAVLAAENVTGAILVRRLSDGAEWAGGGARVDQRFLPASTFKIPNSLIILETGVIADPQGQALAWDGVERSAGWDQDQTLQTAFIRSAVWAYQHWAREVGYERMREHVAGLDYGGGDIGPAGDVDRFWLEGALEISAREQVDFLQRLHARDLPFRAEVQAQVVDIMRHRSGEGWILRAKTGWAIRDEPNHGWYVGWLEADGEIWFFAVNVDLDWRTGEGAVRERLARNALIAVGAPIPPS